MMPATIVLTTSSLRFVDDKNPEIVARMRWVLDNCHVVNRPPTGRKLSMSEWSLAAGRSRTVVDKIIKRGAKRPNGPMFTALAKAVGVSSAWLLFGQGDPTATRIVPTPRYANQKTAHQNLAGSLHPDTILLLIAAKSEGDRPVGEWEDLLKRLDWDVKEAIAHPDRAESKRLANRLELARRDIAEIQPNMPEAPDAVRTNELGAVKLKKGAPKK